MTEPTASNAVDLVREAVAAADDARLTQLIEELSPTDLALAASRLRPDERQAMLTMVPAGSAAELIHEVSESQGADLLEELPPERAAPIIDALDSAEQADLLGEIRPDSAAAILEALPPAGAAEVRQLLQYAPDTAGGMMVTEYLSYRRDQTVADVIADMHDRHEAYRDYDVQYVYVIDEAGRLVGVLRLRDLLFTPRHKVLADVMLPDPLSVNVTSSLEALNRFFDEHRLFGISVVDAAGRLVGVAQRSRAEELDSKQSNRAFLGISGIIGGEEFRSMPTLVRAGRRLTWLSINIVLNILAASMIAMYQDTLKAAIALAVFLPMISDMSGCSGNQAVAVSMRELTLGLLRPHEFARVLLKEGLVGIINGLALGALLAGVAMIWKGNPYLGLVVGVALATNTLLAVILGGLLPLLLKRLKLDPAVVAGPILTTVTDMCGFFLVLSIATRVLPHLTGA